MPASQRTTAPPPATVSDRASLTERRKAQTRMEIARHALRLFTSQGVTATTGEQIAEAAGVSLRTLWRYFPTKEGCVRPILETGLADAERRLRELPLGRPLADAWADDGPASSVDMDATLDLVRLTGTEPGIQAVWLQVHHDAIPVLASALAHRHGTRPDTVDNQVHAGMVNIALALTVERYARAAPGRRRNLNRSVRDALTIAEAGIPRR